MYRLVRGPQRKARAVASPTSEEAREEAARKLITNRAAMLVGMPNPSPYVDQALREAARRLLGTRPGVAALPEVRFDGSQAMAQAWGATAQFLVARMQAAPKKDMSPRAVAAMAAVATERPSAPGE